MKRALAILAVLSLTGCASIFAPDWTIYAPQINDPVQFSADRTWCEVAVEKKPRSLDAGKIAAAAGSGAKQNVVSPEIGAAVGIAGQAAESFGLTHDRARKLYTDCVRRKTDADNSAFTMEYGP